MRDDMSTAPTPHRRRRGAAAVTAVIAILLAGLATVSPARALPQSSEELQFHMLLNQLRTGFGLAPLSWDDGLAATARNWSSVMLQSDTLMHDPNLGASLDWAVPGWTRGGENVGVGWDVTGIHNAFVNSGPHFANMVGDFNRVGIGVQRNGPKIFVTVRFAKAPADAPGSTPTGSFDGVSQTGEGTATASGWALDPDTTGTIDVHVYVNGGWGGATQASGNRPDVGQVFPQYGPNRGWSITLGGLGPGTHQVCAYAINAPGSRGWNPLLGCRSVTIRRLGSPFGSIDGLAQRGPGELVVQGWALDPDTTGAIEVEVWVDGVKKASGVADLSRPDVQRAFGMGDRHGYRLVATGVSGGWHLVCVRGINATGTPGVSQNIGCTPVTMPGTPFGSLDSASSPRAGVVRVAGWAIDPEVASAIEIHVYVDGRWGTRATANTSRPDVGRVYPAWGSLHGYVIELATTKGPHQVCAYAINAPGTVGTNPLLGCRPVTVG